MIKLFVRKFLNKNCIMQEIYRQIGIFIYFLSSSFILLYFYLKNQRDMCSFCFLYKYFMLSKASIVHISRKVEKTIFFLDCKSNQILLLKYIELNLQCCNELEFDIQYLFSVFEVHLSKSSGNQKIQTCSVCYDSRYLVEFITELDV